MKAEEFDKIFDEGKEDILQYADLAKTTRPNLEQKKISIDMPVWLINTLDFKAEELGISRQAVIKTWLAEKAKEEKN